MLINFHQGGALQLVDSSLVLFLLFTLVTRAYTNLDSAQGLEESRRTVFTISPFLPGISMHILYMRVDSRLPQLSRLTRKNLVEGFQAP